MSELDKKKETITTAGDQKHYPQYGMYSAGFGRNILDGQLLLEICKL